MADDIAKVTSMRLNEEDLTKFKEFAVENKLSQQQAFNSLIASAELEKAKNNLGDRAKEIEAFRDTVNKLLNFYINSLEINHTTEKRIKDELSEKLSKELKMKTDSILDLQINLEVAEKRLAQEKERARKVIENNVELEEKLLIANAEIKDKAKIIDKTNSYNNTLQEQLEEHKQYKTQYKALEKELEHLKK